MGMVGEFWKVQSLIKIRKPNFLLFPYPFRETIQVSSGSFRTDMEIIEEDRDKLIEQLQRYPSNKNIQAFLMNDVLNFKDMYTKAIAGPKRFWIPSKTHYLQRKQKYDGFSISLDAAVALNEFLSNASRST